MPTRTHPEVIDLDDETPTPAEKNLEKVLQKSEQIKKKMGSHGPLSRFVDDAKILASLVKDYRAGMYRQVPYWTIAAIAFTLLYVFNPLDLMPDVVPFIGVLDDATLFGACLVAIERDLFKYRNWKQQKSIES